MLELADIARAEELRQSRGLSAVADHAEPILGGFMCRGAPGTVLNTAIGLGLSGPASADEVRRLLEFYEPRGIEPRIEHCPFADDSWRAALAEAGFVPRLFENTFFRELMRGEPVRPAVATPGEVRIELVDRTDERQVHECAVTAASGFFEPGPPPADAIEVARRCIAHPRTTSVVARVGSRAVGAGSMEVSGPCAGLFGASVLPEFRRRGIQQALLAERLNIAAERGATVACIGSKPGIATERNVRRMGFQLAYTKVHLVRPGPGLVPVQS